MCGLLAWNFLSSAMTSSMSAVVGNANLVKKVYFPRWLLVAAAVLAVDVTFLTELLVLSAVLLLFGAFVVPWLPVVLVLVILLTVFATGLGLALSVANVYFRDTQHFIGIFLQIWFYLTPILYPIEYVEEQQLRLAAEGTDIPLVTLFKLNPMEHFVSAFRAALYDNRLPTLTDFGVCVASAAVAILLGSYVFARYQGRLAEEL
jgi:ABC-2 type transport system permease protein